MTERLPYEEELAQQWNDLPLPDVNMAWVDMRRRLDEDDDKPLLPFWLRGCAGWLLLGIVAVGLSWLIVRPEKWFGQKNKTGTSIIPPVKKTIVANDSSSSDIIIGTDTARYLYPDSTQIKRQDSVTITINNIPAKSKEQNDIQPPAIIKTTEGQQIAIKQGSGRKQKNISPPKTGNEKDKPTVNKNNHVKDSAFVILTSDSGKTTRPDSAVSIVKNFPKIDSVKKVEPDFVVKTDSTKTDSTKKSPKDKAKKKTYSFSAGLALHQQLPIAGQSFVPYSAFGRKSSLADYIPSIYFRLNRDDKWFIQTGFRYGAPQLVKELQYMSRADTISPQKYNTTTARLQKTFYHQIPVTFNYIVTPGLSIGAGVVWNKFAKAVSLKDIIQTDRFTGLDTAISTNTIFNTRKADSNFVTSYFQATMEAQYKWRRFSIGVNYSFGLQPYIRFVIASGQTQEEKNKALQLFIRYELWNSKKKKSN